MNIFLSGKIDPEAGSWRDAIVGSVYDYELRRSVPHWIRPVGKNAHADFGDPIPPWPREPNNWVLGLHNYIGPYRTETQAFADMDNAKYEGFFHGSIWFGSHGEMEWADQVRVSQECRDAINRADLVFGYLNRPDAFGTLVEIGMAIALGKFVYLVHSADSYWDWEDYWFAGMLADHATYLYDATTGLRGDDEEAALSWHIRNALVLWTGREQRPQPRAMALAAPTPIALRTVDSDERRQFAASFSQIARWTSDPRVRAEARRMLAHLAGA